MTPEKRKIAAECFRKGNEAIPKENWDYAIQMYTTSVKLVPDNLMFRQTLRATEQKKYGGNGTGGTMAGMRLMTVRGKIKKARYSKAWPLVEEAAEEGLAINPWDPQLNADLGDACREQGYEEVAIFAYEESLKKEPTNKDVNQLLAEMLEERGEFVRATSCWERILKVEPLNGAARSKIQSLQTKAVIERGGYEGAENTRGMAMSDHEVAKRLGKNREGKEADGPGQSVEADLQRAIRKDPASKDNYLKLADYYKREGKLLETEAAYRKALEVVGGGDLGIREMVEDSQLEVLRHNLNLAKEEAANNPDKPELRKTAGALAAELMQREIEVFSTRSERYPADMRLKFDLASRYMKLAKWQLAIPLFQAATSDQRIKGESLIQLGQCFMYDKKLKLAYRQFETAIPLISHDTQPDLYKTLFYSMGRLCEEMKDIAGAEKHYLEVLAVDYSYRDTVARLEKLQEGGDTGAAG